MPDAPFYIVLNAGVKIATDGETKWMRTPIEFSVAPEPLLLLKPIDGIPETA